MSRKTSQNVKNIQREYFRFVSLSQELKNNMAHVGLAYTLYTHPNEILCHAHGYNTHGLSGVKGQKETSFCATARAGRELQRDKQTCTHVSSHTQHEHSLSHTQLHSRAHTHRHTQRWR